MPSASRSLLKVTITRTSDDCPFLNDKVNFTLAPGEILWLRGSSGAGKSYTCMHLSGLQDSLPGAKMEAEWDTSIPASQRIGFLFQKGVLLDALNLAENIALSLRASGQPYPAEAIASTLEAVGLSGSSDGAKMPGELSGGMLRRAALAQILAQRKRLVILDEPFVGLDPPVAAEVVKLIGRVAKERKVAMVLVSHMAHLAAELKPAHEVVLERARPEDAAAAKRDTDLSRLPFGSRALRRLADYFLYSLPLIVCAFGATGGAVSMLLADMLRRVDVVAIVSGFLETYLKGNPALPMVLQLVDRIVKSNEAEAKAKLYALALGSVFTIELGPLLTALLLAGRIGGSYAGEVAMMAATNQLDLLRILGVHASRWTFAPALLAALIAAPLLTAIGTAVALWVGALVGDAGFGLISTGEYWKEVRSTVLDRREGAHLLKWALLVNIYRSIGFMASTLMIAQLCARWRKRAQPRHVPIIITTAVVLSCLVVLLLDWGFSQMYVRLDDTHLAFAETDPSAIYRDPAAAAEQPQPQQPVIPKEGGGAAAAAQRAAAAAALSDFDQGEADMEEYDSYYASGGPGGPPEYGEEVDVDGDREEL